MQNITASSAHQPSTSSHERSPLSFVEKEGLVMNLIAEQNQEIRDEIDSLQEDIKKCFQ